MDGHERLLDRYKVLRSRVSEVVISGMKVGTEHGFGVRRTCVLASSWLISLACTDFMQMWLVAENYHGNTLVQWW